MKYKKKILMLGGYGFLGNALFKRICSDKKYCNNYDVFRTSRRDGIDLRNLRDAVYLIGRQKPDIIINCAAHVGGLQYTIKNMASILDDNVRIISNIFESVCKINPEIKIISPLSNCSYPAEADEYVENKYWDGNVHDTVMSYGTSRRLIVAYSKCYNDQHNLKSINWLVPNAYGPGDYVDPIRVHALNGIIIRLLQAQKANSNTFSVWGSGKPMREWIYIDDVLKILLDNINMKSQIDPINMAKAKCHSINDIINKSCKLLNYFPEIKKDLSKPDGAKVKILNNELFNEKFPNFEFTPIMTGILNTINYYRDKV